MSKPTRTDNNKPSQSTPIRKGTMTPDMITKVAEELTKNQLTTTWQAIKTYKTIIEKKAPKIEPVFAQKQVKTPWNYKVYAEALKAMISEHETVEVTGDKLHEIFPQARCGWEVALQLKRSHWLSYRRVENGRNDTYVFFVEPTREELIVQLTSAESKVIELEEHTQNQKEVIEDLMKSNIILWKEVKDFASVVLRKNDLILENTQLKSDLFYSKRSNIITLAFAIWAVITIIFKSVAL